MAIEIFPDSPSSSLGMSPRISFSHDLSQYDVVPVEQYIRTCSSSSSPSSTVDFDFCVFRQPFDHDLSISADELFSDGKILPIEIKKRLSPPPPPPPLQKLESPPPPPPPYAALRPPPPPAGKSKKPEITEEKQKSFWRFKRSSSLNCGSGYGRTLCPLPLLSRSNSTGSAASGKRSSSVSGNQKQSFLRGNLSNTSKAQNSGNYSSASRPPLKKNNNTSNGVYGNGVKFNPVLHVPPASIFGLGSLFYGGRSKKKCSS